MGLLSFLFGNKNEEIKSFYTRGAIIIDVRTKGEYDLGAIPGSKNIPLQIINAKIKDIKKLNKPIVLCCASGIRSGQATSMLKRNGVEAYNGGGWHNFS